jgi:hypothetical protein
MELSAGADLVATLKTPEGSRFSELERLRRPPTRTTGTAFARALERVDEIGTYRLGRLKLSQIPPNRMAALARYALGSKAPTAVPMFPEAGVTPPSWLGPRASPGPVLGPTNQRHHASGRWG